MEYRALAAATLAIVTVAAALAAAVAFGSAAIAIAAFTTEAASCAALPFRATPARRVRPNGLRRPCTPGALYWQRLLAAMSFSRPLRWSRPRHSARRTLPSTAPRKVAAKKASLSRSQSSTKITPPGRARQAAV